MGLGRRIGRRDGLDGEEEYKYYCDRTGGWSERCDVDTGWASREVAEETAAALGFVEVSQDPRSRSGRWFCGACIERRNRKIGENLKAAQQHAVDQQNKAKQEQAKLQYKAACRKQERNNV